MEFVASETNTTNMISWEDLHPNPKRVGSGGGFYTHHNYEEDGISNSMLLQHNNHHNMLSFSLLPGWGALRVGLCAGSDPEPGRCRRTDGKKWRCSKNAVGDQKYCERHINRGRHRSRKLVEAQNGAKAMPISKTSCEDNSKPNMEAMVVPMLSSSSLPRKRGHVSDLEEKSTNAEFGLVCSDALLNPMHKSDAKSDHLYQFMENWGHSSQPTMSNTSERFDLSRVRMGLGKQEHRVPGGPLGEVLRHSTSK